MPALSSRYYGVSTSSSAIMMPSASQPMVIAEEAMRRRYARDAYDEDIIRRAVVFTAIPFQPRGHTIRRDFATLAEAIRCASTMRDPYGRTGLVYAITAEGRVAQVEREQWRWWLQQAICWAVSAWVAPSPPVSNKQKLFSNAEKVPAISS
jgi:hypothetical protein